ncbi:MAG: cobyric acid synthase [Chloroflexi bacterium]|nr:MAG: cobyric acid synthase [Chloroflexota bacterium]
MTARTLMIQGASSSVGKSLLVTALCRIFARRGLKVAPFKAQNMSNNAAVCPDGSEIGRAQALQAHAAGTPLSSDLNPILIKPEADAHSQIVLDGRPFKSLSAYDYYTQKQTLWEHATAALDRLRAQHDLVIIEGAGSPAELNLKRGDIVNMAIARYADAPVILAGDIDRGGIFAQLLGTLWLLEPEERQLVRGFVVNKFRGDIRLFEEGVRILEEKSGLPVLGVVPYLKDLSLPEEDAVALDQPRFNPRDSSTSIDIVVIRLPVISNFDDFDPFRNDPGVQVRYAAQASEVRQPQAIILPGTKSTMADLAWLRERGFDRVIREHVQRGGALVGICGGYQMLGQMIHDPERIESSKESIAGLGLLPAETFFIPEKATYQVHARVTGQAAWLAGLPEPDLQGYEIHMGRTDSASTWLKIDTRNGLPCESADGSITADGRVWGCYLHGLFGNPAFRHAWLASLGWSPKSESPAPQETDRLDASLTYLADQVEAAVNMSEIERIIWAD